MFLVDRYPALVPPVIIFLLAFFISLHTTWLMRRVSLLLGILDHPDERKPQQSPVPCSGGVAIVLAVAASLLFTYGRTSDLQVILFAGLGIAVVGLLDDIFAVRATIKLLALAVACLILFVNGIGLNRTPSPAVNYVLTFLWVAGVSSAFNAIDNADGLAGSICVISAIAIFLLGWSTWQVAFSFLAMGLAGSALGFLHHNWPPARIYLGDSGSFFLGYILAVLVIFGEWSHSPLRSFLAGCFVVALPLYDLGLTTVLRVRHGIVRNVIDAIAHSDRDHLSHRLLALGLSHGRMLAVLCLINALCCAVALAVVAAPPVFSAACASAAVAALVIYGFYIDKRTSRPELWVSGQSANR